MADRKYLKQVIGGMSGSTVSCEGVAKILLACETLICPAGFPGGFPAYLDHAEASAPRQSCTSVWMAGTFAYRCRTCQLHEASAICKACFIAGKHQHHDYVMYRSEAGGCCDCGDADAWKESGFCPCHVAPESLSAEEQLPEHVRGVAVDMVRLVMALLMGFIRKLVGENPVLFPQQAATAHAGPSTPAATAALEIISWFEELCRSPAFRNILCREILWDTGAGQGGGAGGAGGAGAPPAAGSPEELRVTHTSTEVPDEPEPGVQINTGCVLHCILEWFPYFPADFLHKTITLFLRMLHNIAFRRPFTRLLVHHYVHLAECALRQPSNESVAAVAKCMDRLTVQVFNSDDFTYELVKGGLFQTLISALSTVVTHAKRWFMDNISMSSRLVDMHNRLVDQKLFFCIVGDLRTITRHPTAARHIIMSCQESLLPLLTILSTIQNPQKRKADVHVEYEDLSWYAPLALESSSMLFAVQLLARAGADQRDAQASTCRGCFFEPVIHDPDLRAALTTWSSYTVNFLTNLLSTNTHAIAAPAAPTSVERALSARSRLPAHSATVELHLPVHRLLAFLLARLLTIGSADATPTVTAAVGTSTPARPDAAHQAQEGLNRLMGMHGLANSGQGGRHPLDEVIPPSLRPALPLLMEDPMRLFVWLGEVRCREWVRNGDSITRMERAYRSNLWHDRAMGMDVFLLQVGAALATSREDPVALLLKRFRVEAFAAGAAAVGAPGAVTLLPEMLRLMVWLLRTRSNLGMTPEAQIRYELVQWLCLGQHTYSVLQATASHSLAGHPQFDDILAQVADFKHPQLQEQGCYVLKPECWDEFDRYFLHFSNRHIDEVQERAESLGKLDQVWAFRPPIPAPAPLDSLPALLRTSACRRLFYRVLHEYDSEAWRGAMDGDASENVIVDALQLMELSLHEEERLLSAHGGKTSRPSSLWQRPCAKCGGGSTCETGPVTAPTGNGADCQASSPPRGAFASCGAPAACTCTSAAPLELTWEAVMAEERLRDCPLSLLAGIKPLAASVDPPAGTVSAQVQAAMSPPRGGPAPVAESMLEALQRLDRDTEHKGIKRVTGRMLARIMSLQASWQEDSRPASPRDAVADDSDSGDNEQADAFAADVMLPARGLHVSVARRPPRHGMPTTRGPTGSRDSSEEPRPPRSASDASPTQADSASASPSPWKQQALERKAAIMAEFAARQSRFASISPVSSRGDLCTLDSPGPSTGRVTPAARDWATPSSATAADSSDRSTPLALFQVGRDSSNNTLSDLNPDLGISPGPSPASEGLGDDGASAADSVKVAAAAMGGASQEGCQAGGGDAGGGVAASGLAAGDDVRDDEDDEACALCHGEEGSASALGLIALVQRSNLVSISHRPWRPMPWMQPHAPHPDAKSPNMAKVTSPLAATATLAPSVMQSPIRLPSSSATTVNPTNASPEDSPVHVASRSSQPGSQATGPGLTASGGTSRTPRERELADAMVRGTLGSIPLGAAGALLHAATTQGAAPPGKAVASPSRPPSRDAKEDALQAVSLDGENRLTLHVHVCGHKVHQACFHRYFDALLGAHADRARQLPHDTGQVADVERMEFLCPICRRLANSVLPAERSDWPPARLQARPAAKVSSPTLSPSPCSPWPGSAASMSEPSTCAAAAKDKRQTVPPAVAGPASASVTGTGTAPTVTLTRQDTGNARASHSGPKGDASSLLGPWDRDPRSLTSRILRLHPGIPDKDASWHEHGARCQAFWDSPGSASLGAALREFVLQCHCAANDVTLVADASSIASMADLPPHELLWPIFASNLAHTETALRATHHGSPGGGAGAGGKGKGGGGAGRDHPMSKVEPSGSSWLMLKALRPLCRLTLLASSKGSAVTKRNRRLQLLAWLDGRMEGRAPLAPPEFFAAQKPAESSPTPSPSPSGVASPPLQLQASRTAIPAGASAAASIKAGGLGLVSVLLSGLPMDISTEAMWRPREQRWRAGLRLHEREGPAQACQGACRVGPAAQEVTSATPPRAELPTDNRGKAARATCAVKGEGAETAANDDMSDLDEVDYGGGGDGSDSDERSEKGGGRVAAEQAPLDENGGDAVSDAGPSGESQRPTPGMEQGGGLRHAAGFSGHHDPLTKVGHDDKDGVAGGDALPMAVSPPGQAAGEQEQANRNSVDIDYDDPHGHYQEYGGDVYAHYHGGLGGPDHESRLAAEERKTSTMMRVLFDKRDGSLWKAPRPVPMPPLLDCDPFVALLELFAVTPMATHRPVALQLLQLVFVVAAHRALLAAANVGSRDEWQHKAAHVLAPPPAAGVCGCATGVGSDAATRAGLAARGASSRATLEGEGAGAPQLTVAAASWVKRALVPFLRRARLLVQLLCSRSDEEFLGDLAWLSLAPGSQVEEEYESLRASLDLPSLGEALQAVGGWAAAGAGVSNQDCAAERWWRQDPKRPNLPPRGGLHHPRHLSLIPLPELYQELYTRYVDKTCPCCGLLPKEPALCLICGILACCSDSCCKSHGQGECFQHAAICGAGTCVFLLLHATKLLLIQGRHASLMPSVYLDSHGEDDVNLRRGRPLYLNHMRYNLVNTMWKRNLMIYDTQILHSSKLRSDLY